MSADIPWPCSTTWAERIRPHLTGAVEHILAAGRELNAAKEALPHGAFGPLLADLGLSRPMAHRFMTVANNPVLTSCSPVNTLPAAVSVLATLAQLDDDTLTAAIESGKITPSTTRADARQLVNHSRDPFLSGKMDDLPVAARSPNGCSCMVCGRFGNVCLDYEAGHQLCSMCADRVLKDYCRAIATSTPQPGGKATADLPQPSKRAPMARDDAARQAGTSGRAVAQYKRVAGVAS